MNKFLFIILLTFFSISNCYTQLVASRYHVDLGEIGYNSSQKVVLPVLNQSRQLLKVVGLNSSDGIHVTFPDQIATFEKAEISFISGGTGNGKFEKIIWFQNDENTIEIRVFGKMINSLNTDCYDFGNSSAKRNYHNNKTAFHSNPETVKIYNKNEKDYLICADINKVPLTHLVILIDVSGSMGEKNKMEVLRENLLTLVEQMRPDDFVSILAYREESQILVNRLPCSDLPHIKDSVEKILAGGFTDGMNGIESAVEFSVTNGIRGHSNQILMMTDGAFNLGASYEQIKGYLNYQSNKMNFRFSVISIGYEAGKNNKLKSLSKSGNGYYFELGENKTGAEEFNRILMKKLTI